MPSKGVALVDASFFGHLRLLGHDGCDLLEFILDCHGGCAEGDGSELEAIDYCVEALSNADINHHGISDREAMEWYSDRDATEAESLRRLFEDGADLKLLIRAISLRGKEMLLSCDRRLLFASARYDLSHRCFKATIAYTDESMGGGVRNRPEFCTDQMETGNGHPFFYYGEDKHCPRCDPKKGCIARGDS